MGCREFHDNSMKLWLEVGTQAKNAMRYISIDQACEKFGSVLCNALSVFHVFTGSDYSASFKRKKKVEPFKLLEKSTEAREVFSEMNTEIRYTAASLKEWRSIYGCYMKRRNAVQ